MTIKYYIYKGKLLCMKEIAKRAKLSYSFVYRRIRLSKTEIGSDVTPLFNPRQQYFYDGKLITAEEIATELGIACRYVLLCIRKSKIEPSGDVTAIFVKRKRYIYRGELLLLKTISEVSGVPYQTITNRIYGVKPEPGSDVTGFIDCDSESFRKNHSKSARRASKRLPFYHYKTIEQLPRYRYNDLLLTIPQISKQTGKDAELIQDMLKRDGVKQNAVVTRAVNRL